MSLVTAAGLLQSLLLPQQPHANASSTATLGFHSNATLLDALNSTFTSPPPLSSTNTATTTVTATTTMPPTTSTMTPVVGVSLLSSPSPSTGPTATTTKTTTTLYRILSSLASTLSTTTTNTTITGTTQNLSSSSSPPDAGATVQLPSTSETFVDIGGGGISVGGGGGGGGGGIEGYVNTPLNAPEASLDLVTSSSSSSSYPPLLGSGSNSGDLEDLGWIIPVAIVCIAIMFGLAFACYFGVRKLELRMLGWCYRNCSCCCAPGEGEGGRLLRGEQYDTLNEEGGRTLRGGRESVRLRDFRERSPSYGTKSAPKNYKKDFNPFDDADT